MRDLAMEEIEDLLEDRPQLLRGCLVGPGFTDLGVDLEQLVDTLMGQAIGCKASQVIRLRVASRGQLEEEVVLGSRKFSFEVSSISR